MSVVFIYFIGINFIAYMVMGNDKKKARRGQYRTAETTLWMLAFLGGGPGSYAAMQAHRHKTKHAAFKYGMPVLAVIELIIAAAIGGVTA